MESFAFIFRHFVIHGVWYGAYLMRSGSGYRGEQVRPDVADNIDLYSL